MPVSKFLMIFLLQFLKIKKGFIKWRLTIKFYKTTPTICLSISSKSGSVAVTVYYTGRLKKMEQTLRGGGTHRNKLFFSQNAWLEMKRKGASMFGNFCSSNVKAPFLL